MTFDRLEKLQAGLPPGVVKRLKHLALELQDEVKRERAMGHRPMAGYVIQWFLERPRGEQLAIVRRGQELDEAARRAASAVGSSGDVAAPEVKVLRAPRPLDPPAAREHADGDRLPRKNARRR